MNKIRLAADCLASVLVLLSASPNWVRAHCHLLLVTQKSRRKQRRLLIQCLMHLHEHQATILAASSADMCMKMSLIGKYVCEAEIIYYLLSLSPRCAGRLRCHGRRSKLRRNRREPRSSSVTSPSKPLSGKFGNSSGSRRIHNCFFKFTICKFGAR